MKIYFVKFSFILLLLFVFTVTPTFVFGQNTNIGIIKGIWFSKYPIFDGDRVRIYIALQNNSGFDVIGTVDFFDNNKFIGSQEFSTLDGRIIESWIDIEAIFGEHTFSVEVNSIQANKFGGKRLTISPYEIESNELVFIDYDTDDDKIGNQSDLDDDNDGYSDREEIKHNTDPLDSRKHPETSIPKKNSDFILNIFGNSLDNSNTKDDNYGNTIKVPKIIKDVTDGSDILTSLVKSVSDIQRGGKDFIEAEQERILKKKKVDLSQLEYSKKKGESQHQTVKKHSFWITLYSYILEVIHFITSSWWAITFLIIVMIYHLFRFIIRVFKRS